MGARPRPDQVAAVAGSSYFCTTIDGNVVDFDQADDLFDDGILFRFFPFSDSPVDLGPQALKGLDRHLVELGFGGCGHLRPIRFVDRSRDPIYAFGFLLCIAPHN